MDCFTESAQVVVVATQSLSRVQLFVTPWTAARHASLPFATSWNLLKLMSIESEVPSNHLVLCRPLLLPPSIFPSIRVFFNESALRIRWSEDWSFGFSWRTCVQGFVVSAVTVSSPFYWWVGWVAERPGRLPRPLLLLHPWGDWNAVTRVQCRAPDHFLPEFCRIRHRLSRVRTDHSFVYLLLSSDYWILSLEFTVPLRHIKSSHTYTRQFLGSVLFLGNSYYSFGLSIYTLFLHCFNCYSFITVLMSDWVSLFFFSLKSCLLSWLLKLFFIVLCTVFFFFIMECIMPTKST